MARGIIFSQHSQLISNLLLLNSISRSSFPPSKFTPNHLLSWRRTIPSHSMFYCTCSSRPIVNSEHKDSFAKRMAMAGLKPHHRIALGVSGGPDSMALCVLAADWKTDGFNTSNGSNGFIDGMLAIIVDHGLRQESKDEAHLVSQRVTDMGIKCEITRCAWLDGRPKQGHLQKAARDMRYQIFQKVCAQHKIDVLLIAHHADDQAELFIIRLSRNSGVLGLAGMAFTSQLFSSYTHKTGETKNDGGILLVRPLLEFTKQDMYKICQTSKREWVEDPSNQSQLFARCRIRMSLSNLSSCMFKSELQAIIYSCRKTRSYVDQMCRDLINQAVKIMDEGYVVIDLEILKPSEIEDTSLSKLIAMVFQFITQRHRPVRGSTSKMLLEYICTFPCKTSFTIAGCYLCAAPGSKGTKLLVCCSVNSPPPSNLGFIYEKASNFELKQNTGNDLEQIIIDGKSCSEKSVPTNLNVHFLNVTSENILNKAVKLGIISESTYKNIILLQGEELNHFKSKKGCTSVDELKCEAESLSTSVTEPIKLGQTFYFMNRFLVSWDLRQENDKFTRCESCIVNHDMGFEVRLMVDADWLYLADLVKCRDYDEYKKHSVLIATEKTKEMEILSSDYVKLSAQRALRALKSIPVAARRSLPVLMNCQGLLLSIPHICFQHCPCLKVSAVFMPTVSLGGGHTSFI